MKDLYPEESQKMDVIGHLEELRRRILLCLGVLAVASLIFFARSRDLIMIVKLPIQDHVSDLIFIGPTEAFIASVKVAVLTSFIVSFPVILHQAWAFLSAAAPRPLRRRIVSWIVLALMLFAAGIFFSYFVIIPAALGFLLDFSRGVAVPDITLGKYISFFSALILIGGIIFEIPVVIGLLTDVGLLRAEILRRKRHYALIIMLILAAVLTPTQDVFNMLLFALPMVLLYEVGIWISSAIEFRKKRKFGVKVLSGNKFAGSDEGNDPFS